jgi:signal transduction histidine kinase
MAVREWTFLIAAVGHLALAIMSLRRTRDSAVALPLALLCLDMCAFCFASMAAKVEGGAAWGVVDGFATTLLPPFALNVVVTFVGARRAHARVLVAVSALFFGLAVGSAVGFVESGTWAGIFLGLWVPTLVFLVALLLRHLSRSADPGEKARTRMMLAAFAAGGLLATTDIVHDLGISTPPMAPIATLAGSFFIATAVFRLRLFDRDLAASSALYGIALSIAAVVAYGLALQTLGGHVAALVFVTVALTAILGTAMHELTGSRTIRRERMARLAALGRFSSQLAHDLKNPLATLNGALQFLEEERQRGNSLDAQQEFLRLMADQVERLTRIVADYERIGRVDPVCRPADVNAIVRDVVGLEAFAAQPGVSLRAELAEALPPCNVDADLVRGALENVIRNAFEATPQAAGGVVTVRTTRAPPSGVEIAVEDHGEGMDARLAERAFDDFFTTKSSGSGLGLAFVRRVAQAHGGEVSLRSQRGVGTTVKLLLPVSTIGGGE